MNTMAQMAGGEGGGGDSDSPRVRSHPHLMRVLPIRHRATHRIVAYGSYAYTRRLYWLESWMMREHEVEVTPVIASLNDGLNDLRDNLELEGKRLAGNLAASRFDSTSEPIIEQTRYDVRTPLAGLFVDILAKLDAVLVALALLERAGEITRRSCQDDVRKWRRAVWTLIKSTQAEIDGLREAFDPDRAEAERRLAEMRRDAELLARQDRERAGVDLSVSDASVSDEGDTS